MPHRWLVPPPDVARALSSALVVVTAACSSTRSGELRVTVDSTVAPEAREVIASPVDPASLGIAVTPGRQTRSSADSIARYRALADSASGADELFQNERTALNAAAKALRGGDRHARGYARSYDSLERRTVAAEQLRTTRDRLRARAELFRARLPALTAVARPHIERRALDSVAAASGRPVIHSNLAGGWALLALPPGEWWIGLARRDGSLILPATALRVLGRGRDSLRLPVRATR